VRDRTLRPARYAAGRVSGNNSHARRLAAVERAFRTLPDRYLGAEPGFDATYHIRLGDVGHTWEVRVTTHGARVRKGITNRRPDVTIGTDSVTWMQLREGRLSGIEAFSQRRLYARGQLDQAIAFEGLFRLPNGRAPLLRVHDVRVGRTRISTLTMGAGRDVLLLHGLGATKASFFDTAAALSRGYRVHALDLPGFGSSSKPATAPYNAGYFAEAVLGVMDELGVERAHLVGNSLGGRAAIEVGLRAPERVSGLALLCPAVAFLRRGYHPIVRLLRPEFGILPHRFGRQTVTNQFLRLFADPSVIDPSMADIVVEEFQRIYGSAGARLAFLTAARNVYLEKPLGAGGFYPRLAGLRPPALFVWASHDRIVPAGFARHVAQWLPSAEQIVIDACGHAPQVERPQQTNGLLRRFFARVEAFDAPVATSTRRAAA
jgi:pimeloyl-ACP methyl ester carboxylesterase